MQVEDTVVNRAPGMAMTVEIKTGTQRSILRPKALLVVSSGLKRRPQALADPVRFMAYAMAHALHEDMTVIRRYVSDDDFREALDRAPPGIIDPRSWAYWNSKFRRFPPPPLPTRHFG